MSGRTDDWAARLRLMNDQLDQMIACSDARGSYLLGALLCDARAQVVREREQLSGG